VPLGDQPAAALAWRIDHDEDRDKSDDEGEQFADSEDVLMETTNDSRSSGDESESDSKDGAGCSCNGR
jgi:hypothetical protein